MPNIRSIPLAAVLFLSCLLSPAHALQSTERIKLADGKVITGDAIGYDEVGKVVTFRLSNGQEVKYELAQLDQRSVYQVTRSRVPNDNGKAQLTIGNYARDIGLYAHSARHYRNAVQADPSLKPEVDAEVQKLKQLAAPFCLDNARKAQERGDWKDAEHWVSILLEKMPDQPQAAEAKALLDEHYTRTRAAQQEKALKNAPDLQKELATGKKYYDSMVEKTKDGLTQDSAGTKAINQWQSGIKDGERALKELDKAEKKFTDAATRETLAGYRTIVNDQIIELHMHLASQYMVRTSYNKAAGEVNQALAIDPQNERALAMRSRIENEANDGWRWFR